MVSKKIDEIEIIAGAILIIAGLYSLSSGFGFIGSTIILAIGVIALWLGLNGIRIDKKSQIKKP